MIGVLTVGMVYSMALPLNAQVTYTVFPVRAAEPGAAAQPTTKQGVGALVTLTLHDSTIRYAINEIARQARLQPFIYNGAELSRQITVHVTNVRAIDALTLVLKGTGLAATMAQDGETVVIRTRGGNSSAERVRLASGIVVGHVTDSASGAGLGGAQVRVAGVSNLSAVTSDSGNFTLRDVPSGDQVLTVRLFGYRAGSADGYGGG